MLKGEIKRVVKKGKFSNHNQSFITHIVTVRGRNGKLRKSFATFGEAYIFFEGVKAGVKLCEAKMIIKE